MASGEIYSDAEDSEDLQSDGSDERWANQSQLSDRSWDHGLWHILIIPVTGHHWLTFYLICFRIA